MMTFAQYWWVYLIVAIFASGFGIIRQFRRMQSDDPFNEFGKGMITFAMAGLVSFTSFVLFVVAILWLLIKS